VAATARTPAQHREVLDLVAQHRGNVMAAAKAAGVARDTLQSRYYRAQQWDKAGRPNDATSEGIRVDGDTAELTRTTHERIRTLADLIRVCEIDTTEWEVERWVANKWEMGYKDAAAKAHALPLYQVKAWLKRKVLVLAVRDEIEALKADARRAMPRRAALVKKPTLGNLLEISIPDLHVGKLAWAHETGWENYDGKIAERIHDAALAALLARTSSYKFERVLFVFGNDILHADTKQGTTTSGTPLDTDSRYHKSYLLVRRMLTRAIDRCREIAPVSVLPVPGNHDTLAVFHLGDSLECYYHGCTDVTVDNAPRMRKYYRHGAVMLMFTHGNKGKLDKYPQVMAAEEPEMFGATKYREAHTGDKHQLKVQEHFGVKVRISPALCPPDAWHAENHFVGSNRSAEAFVWNRDEGLIGTAYYTVPSPKNASEDAA
jgi:hypothetical protein